MSSSNRPSKRPSRAEARGSRRPESKAKRPDSARAAAASRRTSSAARRPASTARKAAGTSRQDAEKPRRATAPPPSAATARPAIRLPGSATSRLTIKPGPIAAGAPLELSTKRRPPGPRLLSEVLLDEDEVLIDVFDATLEGITVRITAVLERTCVYVDRDGDRRLARKTDLWVEADKLPIRRRALG